jgi:hypothetical protein
MPTHSAKSAMPLLQTNEREIWQKHRNFKEYSTIMWDLLSKSRGDNRTNLLLLSVVIHSLLYINRPPCHTACCHGVSSQGSAMARCSVRILKSVFVTLYAFGVIFTPAKACVSTLNYFTLLRWVHSFILQSVLRQVRSLIHSVVCLTTSP